MRLTLRTLLAYLDDTLPPAEARQIGLKVAENPPAQELVDRIRRVTRRRGLATPPTGNEGSPSDPNTVAEFLSDALPSDQVASFEKTCLDSDVHLAEVAACHQILTLVLSEQVRVPPTARKRMYQLVKGRESLPDRKPGKTIPVGGVLEDQRPPDADDTDAPFLLGMSAYSRSDSWSARPPGSGPWPCSCSALGFALWMAIPSKVQPRPEEPDAGVFAAVPVPDRPGTDSGQGQARRQGRTKHRTRPPESRRGPSRSPRRTPRRPRRRRRPDRRASRWRAAEKDLAPKEPPPRPDRVQIGSAGEAERGRRPQPRRRRVGPRPARGPDGHLHGSARRPAGVQDAAEAQPRRVGGAVGQPAGSCSPTPRCWSRPSPRTCRPTGSTPT